MTAHITGVFSSKRAAESAVQELMEHEVDSNDIHVEVDSPRGHREASLLPRTNVVRLALAGAAIGALLGAVGGALLMPAGAALPLAYVIRGAVMGMATGFFGGGAAGMEVWTEKLGVDRDELHPGTVQLSVDADGRRAEQVRRTLAESGADDVYG